MAAQFGDHVRQRSNCVIDFRLSILAPERQAKRTARDLWGITHRGEHM